MRLSGLLTQPLAELILLFNSAITSGDADHIVFRGNAGADGGPVTESTYNGFGFRVDRGVLPPTFEFAVSTSVGLL